MNVGAKLKSLQGQNCHISQLDIASPGSIANFKKIIGDKAVSILLNIAGQSQDMWWMTDAKIA